MLRENLRFVSSLSILAHVILSQLWEIILLSGCRTLSTCTGWHTRWNRDKTCCESRIALISKSQLNMRSCLNILVLQTLFAHSRSVPSTLSCLRLHSYNNCVLLNRSKSISHWSSVLEACLRDDACQERSSHRWDNCVWWERILDKSS